MKNVLVIEKGASDRKLLVQMLNEEGVFNLSFVEDGPEALKLLKTRSCDLILSDLDGIQVLKRSRCYTSLEIPIVLIKRKEEPILQGVEDVLNFPIEKKDLKRILSQCKNLMHIIPAHDPKMKHILHQVQKIAQSHSNVFISGESGTGKEVIARMLHNLSKRKTFPFVCVNCAALSHTLIESEFFGHEKGAFTGAIQKRMGRFELADLGSLLLDEVSEIPLALQAKLLRAVQEQEFERVGGMRPVQVDVRLISTSNHDMKRAIKQNTFREDLYYRLNVIPIHLPPLRERKEDILPLAEHFLGQACCSNQIPIKTLSTCAQRKLINYSWPGNIRELRNVIEHTAVMDYSAHIEGEHLIMQPADPQTRASAALPATPITLKKLEEEHILHTLDWCFGNHAETAKVLGISVRTLRNKLKSYPQIKSGSKEI